MEVLESYHGYRILFRLNEQCILWELHIILLVIFVTYLMETLFDLLS